MQRTYLSRNRLRVLIVDDDEDTTATLALLVAGWGHDVCVAHAGSAALDAARDYRPDVVLLDIGMPQLDGWEVARRMRARPEGGDTLLVAVSGFSRDSDRRHSMEAGFHCHLVKPCDPQEIRQILAERKCQKGMGTEWALSN
jgi:CheY-like chemotaxis protein